MMNRKKVVILCSVFVPIYIYLWAYKGPVVVNEVEVTGAYCQSTFKSGTFLKVAYISGSESKKLSILPLGIACDEILAYLKVNKEVLLKQEIGVYGSPSYSQISIDGGNVYYGRKIK